MTETPAIETPAIETPATDTAPARPQRADARRNREVLLAAAAEVFDERGVDAPLEEIARRGGVGVGTLYRHFPNRDAVVEAVYRREVEQLCDTVPQLLRDRPADAALAEWMNRFARYVARKRGLAVALKAALGADNELFVQTHARLRQAIETLVRAAAEAGTIRADVEPMDLLRGLGGICMAADSPGWSDRTARLVSLLMDGLRFGAPNAPTPVPRPVST